MDNDHAKLDIILHWIEVSDAFDITLLYDDPDNELDRVDIADSPITFDVAELNRHIHDADEYGAVLSTMLFEPDELRDHFSRALSPDRKIFVHIRLLIVGAPARYQAIRWETLREPGGGPALAKHEKVRFSRFLDGPGWVEAGSLARGGHLRALVVVADPLDIADYGSLEDQFGSGLAHMDIGEEVQQAVAMLNGMQVTVLARGHGLNPTLDNIVTALRSGQDLFYLICHGMIRDGAELLLEKPDGGADVVSGEYLADCIRRLAHHPTIAVLSSCVSAGPGDEYLPSDEGPLSPLGPMLAKAGVSVVVGMQGNVTMTSARDFMTSFFHELDIDGLADRAMAVARGKISGRPDWWMPVLFSRLKHARVWYRPGFGNAAGRVFTDLWERIKERSCTPIVGSGVAGVGILPDRHQLAEEWVRQRQMPLSGPSRRDLATVAQYMKVDSGADMPRIHLRQQLRHALEARHRQQLPDLDWDRREGHDLEPLITAIGRGRRGLLEADDPQVTDDLHAVLASMRLPVYITTSWSNLLEDALIDAGRTPQVRFFDWQQTRTREIADDQLVVDPQHPLVYHLFGTIDGGKSMVLTEDDYFGWLRAWNKRVDNDPTIPDAVKEAFTLPSLMFVGYQLHDWEFRILFQGIKSFAANEYMRDRQHIGVQLPVSAGAIDRDVSQEYLNTYFKDDDLDIYWGSVRDFLLELRDTEPR